MSGYADIEDGLPKCQSKARTRRLDPPKKAEGTSTGIQGGCTICLVFLTSFNTQAGVLYSIFPRAGWVGESGVEVSCMRAHRGASNAWTYGVHSPPRVVF